MSLPTFDVLRLRNDFEVFRPTASAVTAEVINNLASEDRAVMNRCNDTMHADFTTAYRNAAIARA